MSALDPVFTVGHQIAETLRVHTGVSKEEARERTLDMLRRVGIASPERRIDDYPHQLSGGMRQRVMIAAALICGPQLLIADEPTTALDVTVQAQILELLRDLSETSNTALMLITHDLGVVAETCTRMITMYAGEVIEDAAVDDALVRPLHPYTSGLLRSLPHLSPRHGKLPSIPGRVPSIMRHAQWLPLQGALSACGRRAARPSRNCATRAMAARCAAGVFANSICPARCSMPPPRRSRRWSPTHEPQAADIDGCHRFGARSPGAVPDQRSPRHREGGRRRQFRCPPRRDLWHHRRIRIGQDHDRPRAGVSAEAERGRHPAQRRRSAGDAAQAIPKPSPRLPDHLSGPERRAEPAHDDHVIGAGAAGTGARGHARPNG